MASPNDNISLKDGLSGTYKMRAKDISVAQDGTLQAVRHLATPHPVDYGSGGCFHLTSGSGVMTAGATNNTPIYSFRWTSSSALALIRRIRFQAWSAVGFTAGLGSLTLYRCTAWTVADTGGITDNISGDNGNLRTSMAGTVLAEVRHSSTGVLTAGTRTKDANPLENRIFNITNAANTVFVGNPNGEPIKLFEKLGAEHPLTLVQNEGFTLQQVMPATGTWGFAITTEWDEVPIVNY